MGELDAITAGTGGAAPPLAVADGDASALAAALRSFSTFGCGSDVVPFSSDDRAPCDESDDDESDERGGGGSGSGAVEAAAALGAMVSAAAFAVGGVRAKRRLCPRSRWNVRRGDDESDRGVMLGAYPAASSSPAAGAASVPRRLRQHHGDDAVLPDAGAFWLEEEEDEEEEEGRSGAPTPLNTAGDGVVL